MNCLACRKPIDPSHKAHYGLHPECFINAFHAPTTAKFSGLQRRSSGGSNSTNETLTPQNNSFFHGKFKKYSAELAGKSYILKMRQTEAPELPEVEFLCNQIAKTLSIPVAEFFYITFNNENTFVTKNFVQISGSPNDLQHIYHFRNDNQHTCEGIIETIKQNTKSPRDVVTFIKTTLFDALIGNNDRHGRNLAFLISAKKTALSPIYDNVSYLSLESGEMLNADFNPTGKIATSITDEPSMKHYVEEFIRLGHESIIKAFDKAIDPEHITQLVNQSFCSALMKNAMNRLIHKRIEELHNALSH